MPKPGYYYYQNQRALKGLLFFGVFAIGLWLSRIDSVNEHVAWLRAHRYWILALGASMLVPALWLITWIQRIFSEPNPKHYASRSDFLKALERYARRNKYKHGWVYYRSRELWPISNREN